ncbi:hypothetical protein SS50377_23872 [Spironucleus salmonicida]|uniref:Uncharacterized protein n=1 Tax=Spironucleus salmonicida TaxID=348837 RepID=V6LTT1_9EUKA|nr:hypothetical protein SS50377_23872 [Spironucleus salmonicida]|eukprot:EST44164.1 Hypothetical protein SS50377_16071 [Spironucleus salmonicida]
MVYLGKNPIKNYQPDQRSHQAPQQPEVIYQNPQQYTQQPQRRNYVEQPQNQSNPPYQVHPIYPTDQTQQKPTNKPNFPTNQRLFSSVPYLCATNQSYFATATLDNQCYIFKKPETAQSAFNQPAEQRFSKPQATLLHQFQLTSDKGPVHVFDLQFALNTLIIATTVSLLLIEFTASGFHAQNLLDLIKLDFQVIPRLICVISASDSEILLNLVSKDVFFDAENRQFFGENDLLELKIGFICKTDRRVIDSIIVQRRLMFEGRISAVSAGAIVLQAPGQPSRFVDLATSTEIDLDDNTYDQLLELPDAFVLASFQGFGVTLSRTTLQAAYFCRLGQLLAPETAISSAQRPIYGIQKIAQNDASSILLGASSGFVLKLVFNQQKIMLVQQISSCFANFPGSNLLGFGIVGDVIFCICGEIGEIRGIREIREGGNGVFWEKRKGSDEKGKDINQVIRM